MQQPTLYIHYHEQINRDFLHKAVAVTREGRGDPCYYNDAKVVEALINTDVVTPEDARHFTHYGCNNINLDSQEDEIREIWNIMPKFVELALNGGHDMLTGRLLTYESKPAEEITSYDELFGIVQSHLEFALEASKKITARSDATVRKNKTFSAESLLLPDCLAQGIDMTRMTRYKHCNVHCAGIATCGDSLYAIDRLVFRENRMSLAALRDILRADWAGHEALRSEILTQFPQIRQRSGRGRLLCRSLRRNVLPRRQGALPHSGGQRNHQNADPYLLFARPCHAHGSADCRLRRRPSCR